MAALLEIGGLSFSIGGKAVLSRVDLAVRKGEIHALIGTNGTGKTTLARIVMGCAGYAPTAGNVRFQGETINQLPIHERARLGITMAWQEPARFEGLTVRDYLRLGSGHMEPAAALQRVGLAPELYLDRMADKDLSGGERKRIELASVLTLEPALALLDEPGAGIDMVSVDEILEVIRTFRDDGAAVLLITHREEIARVADRASHLCGGRIVFSGDPAWVAARYKARHCVLCDGEVCRNG